jgi:hypothetical protein
MPESVEGWTMPDWSVYGTAQLENLRNRYQDAITRHKNNPNAEDNLDYWRAHVQSLNAELDFRKLAK